MQSLTSYLRLVVTFLGLTTLASCNLFSKEDDTQPCNDRTESYQMDDYQKRILPYTGYDTIRMVSNTGDTLTCIGRGKQYFTTQKFEPYSDPGCGNYGTYSNYEAYKIEFVDGVKNEKIELAHLEQAVAGRYKGGSTIYVHFRGGGGGSRDYQVSLSGAYNFLGNTEIQGIVYSNVTKAESDPLDTNVFVLVNKNNGILKIQLNQNERWELLPD